MNAGVAQPRESSSKLVSISTDNLRYDISEVPALYPNSFQPPIIFLRELPESRSMVVPHSAVGSETHALQLS